MLCLVRFGKVVCWLLFVVLFVVDGYDIVCYWMFGSVDEDGKFVLSDMIVADCERMAECNGVLWMFECGESRCMFFLYCFGFG